MKENAVAILIIEDSETYRELLTFVLKRLVTPNDNIIISTAQSLRISKDILAQASFDVVILDLRLPDSDDGIITFATIKNIVKDTPIIVLSGEYIYRNNYIRRHFINLGAFEYLNKSEITNENTLISTIEMAIDYHRYITSEDDMKVLESIKEAKKDFDNTLDTINKFIPEINK